MIYKLRIRLTLHKGDAVRLRFEPFEVFPVEDGESFFAYLAKYTFHFADLRRF